MENRDYAGNLGEQYELYKRFFDLSLEIDTYKAAPFSTNLRLPDGVNDKLDNVRRFYENKLGIKISKNDLIIIALTLVLNLNQEKTKEFKAKSDGQGIDNFFGEFEDALVQAVKRHLFQKQLNKWAAK